MVSPLFSASGRGNISHFKNDFESFESPISQKSKNPSLVGASPKDVLASDPWLKEWLSAGPKDGLGIARSHHFGHPGFTSEPGRVTRGFEDNGRRREWQAEQILKRFGQWPPPEGELYVIQIDQDSPAPPPPRPGTNTPPEKFREQLEAWKRGLDTLLKFVIQYSGQTVVFRAQRVAGKLSLVELNPDGPLRSASHTGQLDPAGMASCNERVCGMAWLRPGIYPYKGRSLGVFTPVQDSLIDVARDVNGDGAIDRKESVLSARAYGFAIQIHPGFPGSPRSVGCQTLPPPDFNILQKIVTDAQVPTFSYVLVRRPNEKTGAHIW